MGERIARTLRSLVCGAALLGIGLGVACRSDNELFEPPNVLLLVWDTVRADRLSLYGADRPTTPFLEKWAREARVFENAMAAASSTLPNHASLFTGRLPTEHGVHARRPRLEETFVTLGEEFSAAGYRTFFWSSNPHLTEARGFAQGFDKILHPWSESVADRTARHVKKKVERGAGDDELRQKLEQGDVDPWLMKDAAPVSEAALAEFLSSDGNRPWFAFVNWMEAHRPWLPVTRHRRRIFSDDQVKRSYDVDQSWESTWSYCFGLRTADADELALTRGLYDATLRELDERLENLLQRLEEAGELDNTLIVVTSDHGELLGEHHLYDHQFSLHAPLTRVPLVLWDPRRVAPGRVKEPVMVLDLRGTLPRLAGLTDRIEGDDLMAPRQDRPRLAEYPAWDQHALELVGRQSPDFDASPWSRRLRVLQEGSLAFIEGEDGRHELYDWNKDPQEQRNLIDELPEQGEAMGRRLRAMVRGLRSPPRSDEVPALSEAERERLQGLGYAGGSGEPDSLPKQTSSSWAVSAPPH